MNRNRIEIEEEINYLESQMNDSDFWLDKNKAQEIIQKIKELKSELLGENKLDSGDAILNILAGAGGDDSEDWTRMLFEMYCKYFERQNWNLIILNENKNSNSGYRNISLEIKGKNVYGKIKNESGVHRLVRISPFNSNDKRHTSFALVEVLPILDKVNFEKFKAEIKEEDLEIETSKSSGPGGQNVNKRETAVRIVHKPTNLSVSVSSERSQEQNKQKAFEMIYAKLYKIEEENKAKETESRSISKVVEIEWGNQIRNYVLHPYKLIKDLRTNIETTDVTSFLEKGEIDEFLEAENNI